MKPQEVSDRPRAEGLAVAQAQILEAIARARPLSQVLDDVVRMVETWVPDGTALILAVDEESNVLHVAASPSLLPDEVQSALDGFPVEAAASYDADLIVSEVRVNPSHPATGEILLGAGYRTWWAARIDDVERDERLGGVVVLRRDDREPSDGDRTVIRAAANLAAIAVTRELDHQRLARQATHDSLTGLPNREHVRERLERIARNQRRGGPNTAVLFLDIDRFKVLNDSVGHEAGDLLLVAMGARLREALRPGDLVARFGGDEFVMVCEQIGTEFDAYMLANRLLEVVQEPFTIHGNEFVVTASIGIAMADRSAPQELLRDADVAMYWAKERGRGRAEVFDEMLRERVVARLTAERDLRKAVEDGSFTLLYQPLVSFESNLLVGFEALLRWHHPTRGLLAPDSFLQVAEECGLIRPIGSWVRNEVLHQAARWRAQHPEWGEVLIALNLSPAELRERDLVPSLARTIDDLALDPSLLAIEVTERLLVEDPDLMISVLSRLHDLGIHLSLDDFGTGRAPFSDLKGLPVQSVKIDRSVIAGIGHDAFNETIAAAVIDFTRRLGLVSIAEGVETAEQEKRLRALGCLLAQGHHFGAPMTPEEVEALLGSRHGPFDIPFIVGQATAS